MPPVASTTETSHPGTYPAAPALVGHAPVLPVGRPAPAGAGGEPPSVAAVRAALADGPRTYRDLVAATGLPGRTVRWAVKKLRDRGLVDLRVSLRDGRRSWFFLREAPREPVRRRVL